MTKRFDIVFAVRQCVPKVNEGYLAAWLHIEWTWKQHFMDISPPALFVTLTVFTDQNDPTMNGVQTLVLFFGLSARNKN